jgi:hypothetical protein
MRPKTVLAVLGVLGVALAATGFAVSRTWSTASAEVAGSAALSTPALPNGVTLRQIAGGTNYYAKISPGSAWMDKHILLGAWEEQPLDLEDVKMDVKMGNNIYWSLAGNPLSNACGGPCRANYNIIREGGMHASAPDVTSKSGSETVAYEGWDEADEDYGPGSNGWNKASTVFNETACVPANSPCGYTVAKYFYTGIPASYGSPGYPIGKKAITQGFGKGVLFWDTTAQDQQFLRYSDTLSADSYWMTDPNLQVPGQGGCGLFGAKSKECTGAGLTKAQSELPANYAWDVTRIEQLEAPIGMSKPITVDVETGCPLTNGMCTSPSSATAAAWHALIAGARGIIWFQHNFSGPCVDFRTFYNGSYPSSNMYNCQQTPGVTLHYVVSAISGFNHEVAALNSVLLSPFAENYVNVGSADVSVMAKDANGTFYVFAGSGKPGLPPATNMKVTFHLAGNYTGPVIVVDEHRTLHAVNGVFTDTFANDRSIHIYEIK